MLEGADAVYSPACGEGGRRPEGGAPHYDSVMSTLLLNLRNVPDDEADEVRALLDARHIVFYETRPSRWGVSAGAIWIADDADADRARALMAGYQAERQARARAELAEAKAQGVAPTWWSIVRDEPLRVLVTLLATLLVLALVALPVFMLSR